MHFLYCPVDCSCMLSVSPMPFPDITIIVQYTQIHRPVVYVMCNLTIVRVETTHRDEGSSIFKLFLEHIPVECMIGVLKFSKLHCASMCVR